MFRIAYVGPPGTAERPVAPNEIVRVVHNAVSLALDSERPVTFTLTSPLAMEAQPWQHSTSCSVYSKSDMQDEVGTEQVQEASTLLQQAFHCTASTATHNMLQHSAGFVVVARGTSGKVTAVATVDLESDACYVRNLCTHVDCRGAQWGNEVLAASVSTALAHAPAHHDILIQVDASSTVPKAYVQRLTAWYARFGFRPVTDHVTTGTPRSYVTLAWPR